MALTLSLLLNGATTTTISGSPTAGDKITAGNTQQRINFVYGVHNVATPRWFLDTIDASFDGGTTWAVVWYCKGGVQSILSNSPATGTNTTLAIITNTASSLVLQTVTTTASSIPITYTQTQNFALNSTDQRIEFTQWFAGASLTDMTTSSHNKHEDLGPGYLVPGGPIGTCLALFNAVDSPYLTVSGTTHARHTLMRGHGTVAKIIGKLNQRDYRGYVGGYSALLSNGILATVVISPLSYQALINTPFGDRTNAAAYGSELESYYGYRAFDGNTASSDSAFPTQVDKQSTFIRLATTFQPNGTTAGQFPIATTSTDSATTMSLTWSFVAEKPTGYTGLAGLPIPVWLLPQAVNKWTDVLYPRPNVGGPGAVGGTTGPLWQSLATLETTINAAMVATATPNWDANYGFYSRPNDTTFNEMYVTALVLRTALRWLSLGVGNSDAQAMADKCALVLANYQLQSGGQAGAIQTDWHVAIQANSQYFTCQEQSHWTSTDNPHISIYNMAEAVYALIEYYIVRGNQSLTAIPGTITVAASLDLACAYLATVQSADGSWLLDCNNVGSYSTTNPESGAQYGCSPTIDLAASLLNWSKKSPTATATQIATWQKAAQRGFNYWTISESTAHGGQEFGEGYTNNEAHAIEMCVRGLGRWYRLTGSALALEWLVYYVEWGYLLCKRVDEVINSTATGSRDLHTGGMMSTIDWHGVIGGEVGCIWAILMTDGLRYHPGLLSYHYFYAWASLAHSTWGYADSATYLTSAYTAQAYITPFTSNCGFATGVDNSRWGKHIPCQALMLLPTQSAVSCSNANVFTSCLEGNNATETLTQRTIAAYNPQASTQTTTLIVKGQAGKRAIQDGTVITSSTSGSDLSVSVSLTAGQISQIIVR